MLRPIAFIIPLALLVSGCGSFSDSNPLSSLGLMKQQKEPIDYSPRPPLAIPPEEQRSQLPPPQEIGQAPARAQTQDVAVAPPSSYGAPAPVPQNASPPAAEDTPWWVRIFGS